MFIGFSKNLGNGFKFNIGTKLNFGLSNKEIKDIEFKEFLESMRDKTIKAINRFVDKSGYDAIGLNKYEVDLDTLFIGSKKYEELSKILEDIIKKVERVKEIKDFGIVGKRKISDEIYKLEDFVKDYVENYQKYLDEGLTTKSIEVDYSSLKKINNMSESFPTTRKIGVLLSVGIFFVPYIFAWFTLLPGYSKTVRMISFIWLIFVILMISSTKEPEKVEVTQPAKIEKSTR